MFKIFLNSMNFHTTHTKQHYTHTHPRIRKYTHCLISWFRKPVLSAGAITVVLTTLPPLIPPYGGSVGLGPALGC